MLIAHLLGVLAFLGAVSAVVSWFIYVPIYLSILRKRAPALYEALGGSRMIPTDAIFFLAVFLFDGSYRQSPDPTVRRHSRILMVTLFGGIAMGVGAALLAACIVQPWSKPTAQ